MIALEDTCAIFLCAGQSRRFGSGDKLMRLLAGRPLVAHAAAILGSLPFARRIATVRDEADELSELLTSAGFETVAVGSNSEQSLSVDAGLTAALNGNASAVLLALGDMPFVSARHIRSLSAAADLQCPASSHADGWAGPPWIASIDWISTHRSDLRAQLFRQASRVTASPGEMRDIDSLADLEAAGGDVALIDPPGLPASRVRPA